MGTFLNPGNQEYQIAINSEIYVDKTPMINDLNQIVNTNQRFVSISRPRRFGKTMAADMICSYYDREADSRSLFENRLITTVKAVNGYKELNWDAFLGQFDVVRIVMTRFFKRGESVEKALLDMQKMIIRDIRKVYPDADYYNDADLIQTIEDVYEFSKKQFVIVIDEWDALFRINIVDKNGQKIYLDFLRDLFKDNKRIALAYMTGILPIKKYGQHSALNMFTEYSMMSPMRFAKYCGFTADEVSSLCSEYGRDYGKMKDWYDGYEVSETIPPDPNHEMIDKTGKSPQANRYSIYSPLSVVESVSTGQIRNYWNNTETYEALAEYIRRDFDGLKESVALLMDGGRVHIDTLSYQNDMTDFTCRDDVLSLLVHLGYLGFDDRTGEVFIPNREILDVFRTSTKTEEWASTFWMFDLSQETLKATWDKDAKKTDTEFKHHKCKIEQA
ncbi:MAG: AAA family ATPase [Lachnospiraceae bacterium]|nr:AAA family ATPase [Lachnospiraceae bacterium]